MTCAATMVSASHCVGLTLPGMMDDPGSFSGRLSSPRPQRGPEPRYRMSLAIFIKLTASVLSAPDDSTTASCAANASNCEAGRPRTGQCISCYRAGRGTEGDLATAHLVWRRLEVETRLFRDGFRNSLCKALFRIEAGADGRSSLSEHAQARDGVLDALNAECELLHVAGELLAERERCGVLQVRPANLDDVVEALCLCVERVPERSELGQELVRDLDDGGNVHGGRERVVR